MDPNATLQALLDEICDPKGSPRRIQGLAADLVEWIAKGGFRPADPRLRSGRERAEPLAIATEALLRVQEALANWRDGAVVALDHPEHGKLSLEEVKYCIVDDALVRMGVQAEEGSGDPPGLISSL